MHTALTYDLTGEDVLITGAGPIGIMAATIAVKAGAHNVVLTDVNNYRLELAKSMGIPTVVNVSHTSVEEVMKAIGIHNGFTVGMEMSGHPDGLKPFLKQPSMAENSAARDSSSKLHDRLGFDYF